MCLQYLKCISPAMREQSDYIYLFKNKSPEGKKKIYDTFAGGFFESKFVFEHVFNMCTLDKRVMVVKNSDVHEESGPFDGGIYYYKAKKEHREFHIGSDSMWRYHFRVFNQNYEDELERADDKNDAPRRDPPKRQSQISVALKKPRPHAQPRLTKR